MVTMDAARTQYSSAEVVKAVPFAEGGAATVDDLALRCRCHNRTEAQRWFGEECVAEANSHQSESRHLAGP